jgi:hypothetical protein
MWSTVTAFFASTDGCLKVAGDTSVPSVMREVTAARPASVAHASSDPRSSSATTGP